MDIVRLILAILLPPLGVFLTVGILTPCGYIPGIVHPLCVIIKKGSQPPAAA